MKKDQKIIDVYPDRESLLKYKSSISYQKETRQVYIFATTGMVLASLYLMAQRHPLLSLIALLITAGFAFKSVLIHRKITQRLEELKEEGKTVIVED
jgi:hypothetical protein